LTKVNCFCVESGVEERAFCAETSVISRRFATKCATIKAQSPVIGNVLRGTLTLKLMEQFFILSVLASEKRVLRFRIAPVRHGPRKRTIHLAEGWGGFTAFAEDDDVPGN
jgi:hypothetical protein